MIPGDHFIVACSGGPDSMALFDMLRDEGKTLVCAHVNYHLRPEAEKESALVQKYCAKYQIPLYRLDAFYQTGNVEAWARKVRYDFFKEVAKASACFTVVLAHHQDDLLETYWMQKEKNLNVEVWGLSAKRKHSFLTVYRPLLHYRKKDLIAYCEKRRISYALDSSNEDTAYRRNVLRKRIPLLSEEEREMLLREIHERNVARQKEEESCHALLQKYPARIPLEVFRSFPYRDCLLRKLLYKNLSKKHLAEIERNILRGNQRFTVRRKTVVRAYGEIEVYRPAKAYAVKVETLRELVHPVFRLCREGKRIEGISLREDDFPLCIRNAKAGDEIALTYGHKKMNRFFIDRKIPWSEREKWPVVENKQGKVIFIAGIGCDKYHYSDTPSIFLVKCNTYDDEGGFYESRY